MNKIFKYQIKRNVEAYVDNMIVNSKMTDSHMMDLVETFQVLKKFNMCLNPTKYIFKVNLRKFLGFIMHQRGINANPENIRDRSISISKEYLTVNELASYAQLIIILIHVSTLFYGH